MIIGEEGNGKSTLLKAIFDKNSVLDYVDVQGVIHKENLVIHYFKQEERDYHHLSIIDYLLLNHPNDTIDSSRYHELAEFQHMLHVFKLPNSLFETNQLVATLSGGERVKLQLLKLSLHKPDFLLLDEPTNDLDAASLKWLESYLLSLHCGLVCVSHDVSFIKAIANRIVHIEQRNRKNKPVTTVFEGSFESYTQSRDSNQIKLTQIASSQQRSLHQKEERLNRIRNAVHDAQNSVSRKDPHKAKVLKNKMKNIKSQEKILERETIIKVDDLEEGFNVHFDPVFIPKDKIIFSYQDLTISIGNRLLIEHATFELIGNKKIGLTGANGIGKSLLIKKIYSDLISQGHYKVAYMPQNYQDTMDFNQSALDYLNHPQASSLLGSMKFLYEEMLCPMLSISEGQKAKVYLAKMILMVPDVLILDEPTRNISALNLEELIHVFIDYNGAILAVSHDRHFIDRVFDYQYQIHDKKIKQCS